MHRNEERLGVRVFQHGTDHGILYPVDLVENRQRLFCIGSQFVENFHRGAVEFENAGMRGIQEMHQKVCQHRLLKGGVEGFNELMGKFPDKADGVGEEQRALVGEIDLARRRVECREKGVLNQDIRPGESAQERRLPGICVSNDRRIGDRGPLAILALVGSVAPDFGKVLLEAVHLASDLPLVLFELALSFPLGADASTLLPKMAPSTGESRQRVGHARQIHLDLRLTGLCPSTEDIEDDLLTVDHGDLGEIFPVALLCGGEFVVEDDHVAMERTGILADLFGLA